jgi:hypothetical protein
MRASPSQPSVFQRKSSARITTMLGRRSCARAAIASTQSQATANCFRNRIIGFEDASGELNLKEHLRPACRDGIGESKIAAHGENICRQPCPLRRRERQIRRREHEVIRHRDAAAAGEYQIRAANDRMRDLRFEHNQIHLFGRVGADDTFETSRQTAERQRAGRPLPGVFQLPPPKLLQL